MKWFLGLFLFTGLACTQSKKKVDDAKEKKERTDWNAAKVNGLIPTITSVQQLTDRLGKADSIIKPYHNITDSFYRSKMTYYYVKGLTYEKYHDTLVFKRMDFTKDTVDNLVLSNVKFDHASTVSYFGRFFPQSLRNELKGTDMDKYRTFGLNDGGDNGRSGWVFYFNEGGNKILCIEHYSADRTK